MKETGILMNGEMVRATLDGRKTQTRRVMKPQPEYIAPDVNIPFKEASCDPKAIIKSPYGKVGDRLWVRETFAYVGTGDPGYLVFRATYPSCLPDYIDTIPASNIPKDIKDAGYKWTPSIFMSRWISRINRKILKVRVERVQDITATDSISEGFPGLEKYSRFTLEDKPRRWFEALWDSIYSKPSLKKKNPYTNKKEDCYVSYPWEDIRETREHKGLPWYVVGNPMVWVYDFKGA